MRAIVKAAPGPGLEVRDVPKPRCGPSDVLIRVHHAGVCGTDLHIADWDEWAAGRIKPPLVLGHEFAGEVVETGSAVGSTFERGQLVTAEGHIVCGRCRQCRTGNGHICRRTSIIGVDQDGAFAEYHAMPATNVVRLDGIPTEIGAVMDPMGNAFHAVLTAEVSDAVVLVLGCGPIGCFAVGVARAAGARAVVAVDVKPKRLALARTMGAARALHAKQDDVDAAVMELTGGDGADVVCEMSGAAHALHAALRLVRNGGRVQLLGIPRDAVPINLSAEIIFKGITIYGVIGRRMYETWHQMQRYLTSGRFDPRPVITHRFPLERIEDALAAIRDGDAGKVVLSIGP
ncbi:MAG: L-threonine 3-dehydrogenase [Gemmatimonadetes bacterium]|nr:L-threonine 3-dehydrogenase [Gemmatimonadota bacterium]